MQSVTWQNGIKNGRRGGEGVNRETRHRNAGEPRDEFSPRCDADAASASRADGINNAIDGAQQLGESRRCEQPVPAAAAAVLLPSPSVRCSCSRAAAVST